MNAARRFQIGQSAPLGFSSAPQPVAAAQSYDKIILTDGQYEYVTVTGSNIPVLASKNPIARTEPQTASPVVTMSPDAFRRMMERAASSNR